MAWWDDYFKDVDTFDINNIAPWFDDDVELYFANWPVVRGKDGVLGAFTDFWKNLKGLSHRSYAALSSGSRVNVEAEVTFTRTDGKPVVARAATAFEKPGDKITALYVYIDVAPVFAA